MPSSTTLAETLRSPIDGTEQIRLATTGANWRSPLSSISRIKLSSTLDRYVSTSGNNSNGGTSPADAWLTPQFAYNTIAAYYDFAGQTATVHLGAGTFTSGLAITSSWLGGGSFVFSGAGSGSTTVNTTSATCFAVGKGVTLSGVFALGGMTLTTTTSGSCIINQGIGSISLSPGDLIFGAAPGGGQHMQSQGLGAIITTAGAGYSISGAATLHYAVYDQGLIEPTSSTVTITTGSLNFAGAFCQAARLGCLHAEAMTFTGAGLGTLTGTRYSASDNGLIFTGGGGANYFPGNAAGSPTPGSAGGVYD